MVGERKVLIPSYLKNFICDITKCEENCCSAKWTIFVDKKHYQMLREVREPDMAIMIKKYFKKNKDVSKSSDYAFIKQDKSKHSCVFLNEDGLCDIHLKLGVGYMSDVCMAYPRHGSLVFGDLEKSLSFSCPVAARLALLNPNPMEFEYIDEEATGRTILSNKLDPDTNHPIVNRFWDIRTFSIGLLQNRNYRLDDRMVLLGLLYKQIEDVQSSKSGTINQTIDSLGKLIDEGGLEEMLMNVTSTPSMQMAICEELIIEQLKIKDVDEMPIYRCIQEMAVGLRMGEDNPEQVSKNYVESYEKYTKPYLLEKEYILENFLVNEYFKDIMPLKYREKSIFTSYIYLCILYSLTKLIATGMAAFRGGLSDDIIVKIVIALSKSIVHAPNFTKHILNLFENGKLNTLAHMAILVKN